MKLYAEFFSLQDGLAFERMLTHFMRQVHPHTAGEPWCLKVTLTIEPSPSSGQEPRHISGEVEKMIPDHPSQVLKLGSWGLPVGLDAGEIADWVEFRLTQFLMAVDGTVECKPFSEGRYGYLICFTNDAWHKRGRSVETSPSRR